jgi:hypothetical protein
MSVDMTTITFSILLKIEAIKQEWKQHQAEDSGYT